MKKVILVLLTLFIGTALADNAPTSVGYVDSQIGALQNKISAVDTNTVLTTTNTAGEIGQKSIYDATGNYVEQQNALVTAEVANAAVQTAIDTEFVCTEWLDSAQHTNENCLIYTVKNSTEYSSSKNLYNLAKSQVIMNSGSNQVTKNLNGWTVRYPETVTNNKYSFILVDVGDINKFLGKTLVVSYKANCINGAAETVMIGMSNDTGTQRKPSAYEFNVPTSMDGTPYTKVVLWLYSNVGGSGNQPECTYYDIQVEKGDTATAYEPYQNLYLPMAE